MSSFFHLCRPSSITIIKKEIIRSQTNSNDYSFRHYVSAHYSDENQVGNKYHISYFHLCPKLFICECRRPKIWTWGFTLLITKHSWRSMIHPCSILNELFQFIITFIRTYVNRIFWIVPPMSNIMFRCDVSFVTIRT